MAGIKSFITLDPDRKFFRQMGGNGEIVDVVVDVESSERRRADQRPEPRPDDGD